MNTSNFTPWRGLLTLVFVLCFTLALSACETQNDTELGQTEGETPDMADNQGLENDGLQEDMTPEVGDIEGDPAQYMGQTVTVDGEINDLYGQNAFTLDGGLLTGELLVIVPPGVTTTGTMLEDDASVQVTGTVRQYVMADLESEFGLDLGTDIDYEEQEPVLVANSIMIGDMATDQGMDLDATPGTETEQDATQGTEQDM